MSRTVQLVVALTEYQPIQVPSVALLLQPLALQHQQQFPAT
jgi:hypothetical protein